MADTHFKVLELKGGQLMLAVFDSNYNILFYGSGYQERHASLSHDISALYCGDDLNESSAAPVILNGEDALSEYTASIRFGASVIADEDGYYTDEASAEAVGELLSIPYFQWNDDCIFMIDDPKGPLLIEKEAWEKAVSGAFRDDLGQFFFRASGVDPKSPVCIGGNTCYTAYGVYWEADVGALLAAFSSGKESEDGSDEPYTLTDLVLEYGPSMYRICDWNSPVAILDMNQAYNYEQGRFYDLESDDGAGGQKECAPALEDDAAKVKMRHCTEEAIQKAADKSGVSLNMHYDGGFELTLESGEELRFPPSCDDPLSLAASVYNCFCDVYKRTKDMGSPPCEGQVLVFSKYICEDAFLKSSAENAGPLP